MQTLFPKAIVQKRNVLNELRANNLTLQELRFFSIYLSKINARDITTRVVRFKLADFQKIMNLGRLNIQQLQASTDSLLGKKVHIPLEFAKRCFLNLEITLDTKNNTITIVRQKDDSGNMLSLDFPYKLPFVTDKINFGALDVEIQEQIIKQNQPDLP